MSCPILLAACGLLVGASAVAVGARASGARIDLIERMHGSRVEGVAARGETLAHRSPYRALPGRMSEFVSTVTIAFDPSRAAYEMREAIGLAPRASVTWDLALFARARVSGAASVHGEAPARVRLTWRPRGGAEVVVRDVDIYRKGGEARRQWAPFAVDLPNAEGAGELTLKNVGRRSAWIGNPVVEAQDAKPASPNVVLVMVDTMTAEAVGHLGNPHGVTPSIDALAKAGVTFSNAVTNANWTRPATIALLGGDYSSHFGINVNSWQLDRRARRAAYASNPDTLPLLAGRSSREATAIGNNLFTMGYHAAGFDFGFTRIVDYRTEVRDTRDIVADVEAFFSAARRSPFFLYVALNAPHHPYVPPREFLRKVRDVPGVKLDPEVRRYLGEVAYTDDAVGRIARALERTGLAANTVLIVTADHGEGLREDNAYTHVVFERPSRFTHTVNLYDEVVRIPIVFSGKGVAHGRNVAAQVRLLDIAPTVAEIMTGRASNKHAGSSLMAALRGEAIVDRPAFTEGKRMSSVRFEGWKYIRREKGYDRVQPFGRNVTLAIPEELFNLKSDPRETKNLVAAAPPELAKMRRLWADMQREATGRLPGAGNPAGSPAPRGTAPASLRPAVTTFLLSSDGKRHDLIGELRTSGRFVNWRLAAGEAGSGVWLSADNRLLFAMVAEKGEGRLVVSTEPRDASIEMVAKLDGREVDAAALRVGAYGLPLLGAGGTHFSGAGLAALFAGRAPLLAHGREFGVFVWRDAKPSTEAAAEDDSGTKLESGVESAMRAWGYIQSDNKAGRSAGAGKPGERPKKGDLE